MTAAASLPDAATGLGAPFGAPSPLLFFVIAGLDPAIHTPKRLKQNSEWLMSLNISMDRRIKSGGDESILPFLSERAVQQAA